MSMFHPIARIKQKLAQHHITLPKTINFIKTTGKEELDGTAGYCRKNTIVLYGADARPSEDLLTHELFHIHSQVDPKNRGKLFELIGFHACNPIQLPESLAERRMINPDSPLLNAYIEVDHQGKKIKAIPFDFYEKDRNTPSGGSTFLPHVYHKFITVEYSQEGMVLSQDEQEMISRAPVETPALIEKMRGIFEKKPVIKLPIANKPQPLLKRILKAIASPFIWLANFFKRCWKGYNLREAYGVR